MTDATNRDARSPQIVAGALAGSLGAVSMMVSRPLIERGLLRRGEQESEWERVFRTQARRFGYRPSRNMARVAGPLLHVGYGAALGAAYALLARKRRAHPIAIGIAYGVAMYMANYSKWGLVPRIGALPRPSRRDPRRAAIPLAHHLVFGLVVAATYNRLRRG